MQNIKNWAEVPLYSNRLRPAQGVWRGVEQQSTLPLQGSQKAASAHGTQLGVTMLCTTKEAVWVEADLCWHCWKLKHLLNWRFVVLHHHTKFRLTDVPSPEWTPHYLPSSSCSFQAAYGNTSLSIHSSFCGNNWKENTKQQKVRQLHILYISRTFSSAVSS